jgi:hypothetical protein
MNVVHPGAKAGRSGIRDGARNHRACPSHWGTWRAGLFVALAGEASLRIWAAGHLEKSREVTRSGPYR